MHIKIPLAVVCANKTMVVESVMLFFQAQHTRRVSPPRSAREMVEKEKDSGEKEKDSGEEVEFLDTTVTVSHLPSVQFPETTRSKGTRLVDR